MTSNERHLLFRRVLESGFHLRPERSVLGLRHHILGGLEREFVVHLAERGSEPERISVPSRDERSEPAANVGQEGAFPILASCRSWNPRRICAVTCARVPRR